MDNQSFFASNTMSLDRAVLEVRYPPAFKLPDMRYKILDRLSSIFPEYSLEQLDSVFLRDSRVPLSAFVNIQNMGFEISNKNWPEFKKGAMGFTKEISEVLSLKTATRIGIRSFWLKEFESKEEVLKFMRENLISPRNKHFTKLGVPINNIQLQINSTIGDLKFNLILSPLSQSVFETDLSTQVSKSIHKEALQIDCDIYWDGNAVLLENIKKYIDNAHRFITNNLFEFLNSTVGE